MQRWNGWGARSIEAPLPPNALDFLRERVGPANPPKDASLADALAQIRPSRLSSRFAISLEPERRLRVSYGQSLVDWLHLRFGRTEIAVDGVSSPETVDDMRLILSFASKVGAIVVPCGGATSVVGHLTPPESDRPVLTISLARLRRLLDLDPLSQLATFEAGVAGPDLEAQLRAQGYMLGHYPQSFEYSTLGGWIATRSSGQQSARYGRIEAMLAGARVETPTGVLEIPPFPASAAGPDLREWILGSEGRFGVIAQATMRVQPLPESEKFIGVFFPDWQAGSTAVRALAQARIGLSMLRLANSAETETTLQLAGARDGVVWLERYLRRRGCGDGKVLMLAGFTGRARQVAAMRAEAACIAATCGGVSTGALLGRQWRARRFKSAYFRNSLWEAGYAADTMETAVDWPRVTPAMLAMEQAGRDALAAFGEKCHVYTHLSHVYPQGSSVYSTFIFRVAKDFDANLAQARALKEAVSQAIMRHGGTISHQHGVGKDHAPYLVAEKSARGMRALGAMIDHFDPAGVLASENLVNGRNT